MSNGTFDFNELIRESKEVMTNPKSYFSSMNTSGGLTEPLIKAVIYGAIAGAISFLWSILNIGAAGAGMFGSAVGILTILWSAVGAVIVLFIGGIILLVISSICNGSTDFESNVRVIAAVMVMMPVSAFLSFAGGIYIHLGTVVIIGVSVFTFWLLFHGLVETLKTHTETTKKVLLVLVTLIVLVTLVGMRKINQYQNISDNSDLQEVMKDQTKS